MNDRKEFKISAKMDTSDFDKSIEAMQKKLRDLYAPSDLIKNQTATAGRAQQMGFGGMSQPTSQDYQRATQSAKRENESLIRDQIAGQEKLGRYMLEREKKLEKLKEQQSQMVKNVEKELELKEKIARVEENLSRQRQISMGRDQALNHALDAKSRADGNGTFTGPGGNGGPSVMQEMMAAKFGPGRIGAAIGGAISTVGAGIGMFGNMYRDYGRMPIDTNMALASASQNTVGRDVSNLYGRRTAFEMPFSGERALAAQHALEAGRTARNNDYTQIGATGLKFMGGGVASGAVLGAGAGAFFGGIAGSALPGLGTAAGAIGGGVIGAKYGAVAGGVVGGLAGVGANLMDPNRRALMLSHLPGSMGTHYEAQYQANQSGLMADAYQKDYQAQKDQNPYKTGAVNDFEQHYMRNLGAQRMMGMDNNQFYGDKGYMKSATDARFTPEIALQMSQGIIGAGGSTRSAGGNSILGAQMERGMNLTNAGNVLGSLSGSMGSGDATKNATLKILAEGVRLGLDDSKFAEENRRFTQSVAEVIARTGTSDSGDAQRIAGKFGSFVADNTNNGIAAAKSSYEEYQQMSTATTGGKGVQRAAGFMSDPILGAMSTMDRQALMKVREDEVNVDSNYIKGLAQKYNKTPQEIVDAVGGVNKGSQNKYKEADAMTSKVQAAMKNAGISQLTKENFSKLPKESQADVSTLQGYQMNEFGAKTMQEAQSRTYSTLNGNPGGKAGPETYGPGDVMGSIMNKLQGKTGKIEDDYVAAAANDSAAILKNFNDMKGSLQESAEAASKFTVKVREMNAELMRALDANKDSKDPKTRDALSKILSDMGGAGNQTQGTRGGK